MWDLSSSLITTFTKIFVRFRCELDKRECRFWRNETSCLQNITNDRWRLKQLQIVRSEISVLISGDHLQCRWVKICTRFITWWFLASASYIYSEKISLEKRWDDESTIDECIKDFVFSISFIFKIISRWSTKASKTLYLTSASNSFHERISLNKYCEIMRWRADEVQRTNQRLCRSIDNQFTSSRSLCCSILICL